MKRGMELDPISKFLVNFIDKEKALFEAIDNNRPDVIQLLINEGVNVNASLVNEQYITPLIRAMKNGNMDSIKTLLKAGANVHGVDEKANTALHYAASFGSKDSIEVLVNKGANINAINTRSSTPLMAAAQFAKKNNEAVKILIQRGAQIEGKDNNGNTPLHYAAHGGNVKATEGLLALDAKINATNVLGETPLMEAVARGNVDVIKILIRKGADVYAKTNANKTVLDQAIEKGFLANSIYHLLAVEDAKPDEKGRRNRYFRSFEGDFPEFWLRVLQLNRKEKLENNAIYYLVSSLLNNKETEAKAVKLLDSFKTHKVDLWGPEEANKQIEVNEKFITGMKVLSGLPDELKFEVLKFSNPGPLTYDWIENKKAKEIGDCMFKNQRQYYK